MKPFVILALCATSVLSTSVSAADFAGRWFGNVFVSGQPTGYPVALELRQSGERISGVVITSKGTLLLSDGKATGNTAVLRMRVDQEDAHFEFSLEGDRLAGKITNNREGRAPEVVKFEAVRSYVTPGPFDGTWQCDIAAPAGSKSDPYIVRIYSHPVGFGGFVTSPEGREDVFSSGQIGDGKLIFDLEHNGEHFEVSVSGDRLHGSVRIPDFDGNKVNLHTSTLSCTRKPARKPGESAGAAGTWFGAVALDGKPPKPFQFRLERNGSDYTGSVGSEGPKFSRIAVNGNRVTFTLEHNDETIRFELKLDGDEMSGIAIEDRNGKHVTYPISAVRRN